MVSLVKHDLEFILKQIKIAEEHTAGTPLTDLVSHDLLPYGLRTVDGSYNNLGTGNELFGSSSQIMPRLLNPVFNPAEARPANLHPGRARGSADELRAELGLRLRLPAAHHLQPRSGSDDRQSRYGHRGTGGARS